MKCYIKISLNRFETGKKTGLEKLKGNEDTKQDLNIRQNFVISTELIALVQANPGQFEPNLYNENFKKIISKDTSRPKNLFL